MEDEDQLMRDINKQRVWRSLMYSVCTAAGIIFTIDPSALVVEQVSLLVTYMWSGGMVISALVALFGSLTDRWIGEFSGLPLLASVLAFYGCSAIASHEQSGLIIVAYGLLLVAFAGGLSARWLDVRDIKNNALEVGSGGKGFNS